MKRINLGPDGGKNLKFFLKEHGYSDLDLLARHVKRISHGNATELSLKRRIYRWFNEKHDLIINKTSFIEVLSAVGYSLHSYPYLPKDVKRNLNLAQSDQITGIWYIYTYGTTVIGSNIRTDILKIWQKDKDLFCSLMQTIDDKEVFFYKGKVKRFLKHISIELFREDSNEHLYLLAIDPCIYLKNSILKGLSLFVSVHNDPRSRIWMALRENENREKIEKKLSQLITKFEYNEEHGLLKLNHKNETMEYKEEVVKRMQEKGLDIELISQITQLTKEDILRLSITAS